MSPMKLVFHVMSEKVVLSLHEGEREIDRVELTDMRGLSQTLLPALEALLVRHGVTTHDMEAVDVQSEVSPTYTSSRIVETTANLLRFARVRDSADSAPHPKGN